MAPSPSLAQVYASPVAVAVWEWQDGLGTWHPYSAAVCSYIEQQFVQQKGQRFGLGSLAHSIPLGQADPSLAPYIIDLPSWTQFRQDTGKTLPASSVCLGASFGLGIVLCVQVTEWTLGVSLPLKHKGQEAYAEG